MRSWTKRGHGGGGDLQTLLTGRKPEPQSNGNLAGAARARCENVLTPISERTAGPCRRRRLYEYTSMCSIRADGRHKTRQQ